MNREPGIILSGRTGSSRSLWRLMWRAPPLLLRVVSEISTVEHRYVLPDEALSTVGRLRFGCRRFVRRSRRLYLVACWARRLRGLDARIAGDGTRICIEGFPSSGNTLAVTAVNRAWPDLEAPVIASHRHCAVAVEEAVRRQVPTVVLVRPPVAAVSSCVVRFGTPVDVALDDYIDFYESTCRLLREGHAVRVVDFDTVVRSVPVFLGVVGALVRRSLDPAAIGAIEGEFYAVMEQSMAQLDRDPSVWTIPHPDKERRKAEVAAALRERSAELRRAQELFDELLACAVRSDVSDHSV